MEPTTNIPISNPPAADGTAQSAAPVSTEGASVNPVTLPVTPIDVIKQVETDVKEDTPVVGADTTSLAAKLEAVLNHAETVLKTSGSRELALVRTKIEEAKLWLDKLLQKKSQ
jgi:hypothetical protein